ncbi:MAG TPA: hypothetical protein VGJ66_16970 [Pyrinomonadaceae bacterium]|jgi:hypothetical protein
MIPHRMLNTEIYGNGLKDRVTACRKRLRVNRVAQRLQDNNEPEELFSGVTPSVSQVDDYAAGDSPGSTNMAASVARINYSVLLQGRNPASAGRRSLKNKRSESREGS